MLYREISSHRAYTTLGWKEFSKPAGVWYTYELRRAPGEQRWYLDDRPDTTQTYSIPTPAYINFYGHSGGRIDVDWVAIRRYADPEPVAVVGEEEAADTTPPVSNVDPIGPYYETELLDLTISMLAGVNPGPSGVASVELWYRYSMDNSTWSSWENFAGMRLDGQWTWRFELSKSSSMALINPI